MSYCRVCSKPLAKREKVCPRCGASADAATARGKGSEPMSSQTNAAAKASTGRAPGGVLADSVFNMEKFTTNTRLSKNPPPNTKGTIFVIAFALFACIFVYGIVAILVTQGHHDVIPAPVGLYAAISVIAFVTTFLGVAGAYCGLHPERFRKACGKEQLLIYIRTSYIIVATLTESVTIFGIMLVFVSRNRIFFLPFAAVSVIAMLYQITRLMAALKFYDSFTGPDDLKTDK